MENANIIYIKKHDFLLVNRKSVHHRRINSSLFLLCSLAQPSLRLAPIPLSATLF